MKRLPGSTSSILYEVKTDNSTIVLRQFDNEEWLLEEPDLVRHEAASLQQASASGLPAHRLSRLMKQERRVGCHLSL